VWENLLALAGHYEAELLVGTFSYNKNAYGPLAVKRGTKGEYHRELWYDERLEPYLCDERIELANGLVWCGEMNIQPTAPDPLEGLETYSGRKSASSPTPSTPCVPSRR
jgi:exonuclease III